jgi:L-asparaginase
MLCDALHGRPEPIVLTGAIRPASAPGADGPANLVDAVAAAGAPQTAGLGVLVVFAGELHAARAVRKVASISPAAFGSPATGPLGSVAEGRVRIAARPLRPAAPLPVPAGVGARVPIVPTWLGDDGAGLHAALRDGAEAIVFVALGAGHVAPPVLAALREVAAAVPVALTVRPERGVLLHETYGFEGAERDLRASGALPAAGLSPQAARMVLLVGLGSDCEAGALALALDVRL